MCSFTGKGNGNGKGKELPLWFIVARDSFKDIEPTPVLPSVINTIWKKYLNAY